MSTGYLMHHGVKGQKWGIRRTAEQLGHLVKRGVLATGNFTKSSADKAKNAIKKKIAEKKIKREKKRIEKRLQKGQPVNTEKREMTKAEVEEFKKKIWISKSPSLLYKNAHLFSDDELRNAYNRMNTERQIRDLIKNEPTKGEEYVKKLESAGKLVSGVSTVVQNSSNLYNNVAKVFNATQPEENRLPIIGGSGKAKLKLKTNS